MVFIRSKVSKSMEAIDSIEVPCNTPRVLVLEMKIWADGLLEVGIKGSIGFERVFEHSLGYFELISFPSCVVSIFVVTVAELFVFTAMGLHWFWNSNWSRFGLIWFREENQKKYDTRWVFENEVRGSKNAWFLWTPLEIVDTRSTRHEWEWLWNSTIGKSGVWSGALSLAKNIKIVGELLLSYIENNNKQCILTTTSYL